MSGRDLVDCSYCHDRIDVRRPTTYQRVIGWTHPRSGGGANALTLRKALAIYACDQCIEKDKRGTLTQGELF